MQLQLLPAPNDTRHNDTMMQKQPTKNKKPNKTTKNKKTKKQQNNKTTKNKKQTKKNFFYG
jgi:hypothetical protein